MTYNQRKNQLIKTYPENLPIGNRISRQQFVSVFHVFKKLEENRDMEKYKNQIEIL